MFFSIRARDCNPGIGIPGSRRDFNPDPDPKIPPIPGSRKISFHHKKNAAAARVLFTLFMVLRDIKQRNYLAGTPHRPSTIDRVGSSRVSPTADKPLKCVRKRVPNAKKLQHQCCNIFIRITDRSTILTCPSVAGTKEVIKTVFELVSQKDVTDVTQVTAELTDSNVEDGRVELSQSVTLPSKRLWSKV